MTIKMLAMTISIFQRAGQSQSPVPWEQGLEEHKYSAVMFETEDGKTTSKASRLVKDSESSSNENIRYQVEEVVNRSGLTFFMQAMDMIKKDTRVHRKNSTNNRNSRWGSSLQLIRQYSKEVP